MQQRQNVDVLYLGTLTHQNQLPLQTLDKSNYQDQIHFNHPSQIQLLRLPNHGKYLYSKITSQTQKQPIKSLQIYYRNLDKKLARYTLLFCLTSQLLVSSSDILVTLKQTIFTDLLVIRGNFTNITLCIYGRVLHSKEQIDKKCPYFSTSIQVPLHQDQPSIKIHRNIFNESRTMVKAIQDEYTQIQQINEQNRKMFSFDGFTNDRVPYDSQINNICTLSQQLLVFQDELIHDQQRSVADIRSKLQGLKSLLQKLFKSAHIGLYYPTPYKPSSIPQKIPLTIVKTAVKILPQSLSDQLRALQVLKLVLQLQPHAQFFAKQNGIKALIILFLQFFSSDLVIHSSLKALTIQVLITLSFWQFAAHKMVDKLPFQFQQEIKKFNKKNHDLQSSSSNDNLQQQKQKYYYKQRSIQKKKKRSQQQQKSQSKDNNNQYNKKKFKKQKKSKKQRTHSKDRQKKRDKYNNRSNSKQKSKQKQKSKKYPQKDKSKQFPQKTKKDSKMQPQSKNGNQQQSIKLQILNCYSFYQILFKIIKYQKNYKISLLLKLLIQQITQTLTKNPDLSNQLAQYTPLMRDTKYMFSQGAQIINSKTLKTFAAFQPFLNQQQSKGVLDSTYLCQSQKIKHYKKYGISPKLFKLIDSALTTIQSKNQDQIPLIFDQQFITLISSLIQNNKNGIAIGLNNFIDVIKIDTLLGLKKMEAVVAIVCQYIYQIFLQDQGMNLIYYIDQIHNLMLKISGWLRQDKTFSLQIKRKVQCLINSALIFNHFNAIQGNFKIFSQYFTKLIGHQHLDINKIVQYTKREYNKTVNPLTFTNLSQNFSLGNFYDVLPAQPLHQIDICLKVFMAILKLNKNIWTLLYQFKFIPAFATLYLKIHSLLKFFLTPSLQRQNAIIGIKIYQRLINNYMQVAKHLLNIFVCKLKYQSSFNQLVEQKDIFDTVQLYQKWVDTYLFLYHAINIKDTLISSQKSKMRIKDLLSLLIQIFDTIFKGYQLTKNIDRQRNIKSLLKFIYRQHYQSIIYRPGIFSLLKIMINLSNQNTFQILKSVFLDKSIKNCKDFYDILLPDNQKCMLQNMILRNIYRLDPYLIQNISGMISQLLKKQNIKQQIYQIIQTIIDLHKQDHQQNHDQELLIQKSILYTTLLSFVTAPFSFKIQQQMLRFLKNSITLRIPLDQKSQPFQSIKTKLINAYLKFFKTAIIYNPQFSQSLFQQYLKIISNFLHISSISTTKQIKLQQLKAILTILQTLSYASSNVIYQSILLYGDYLQKPYKSACQINLQKIFLYFFNNKNKNMIDQKQSLLFKSIAMALALLLCKLTTIDGHQFYSTQCRKNAINTLISPQKQFTLSDVVALLSQLIPQKFIQTLKNYIDFPILQKIQSLPQPQKPPPQKKTPASIYSKSVFTMISQNDPVGKTRFQLIQQRWQGGDTQGQIYQVNFPLNYQNIVQQHLFNQNPQVFLTTTDNQYWQPYYGIHPTMHVNHLFQFKIRKIFIQQAKKNAIAANSITLMKNIPNQIKKLQPLPKQPTYPIKPPPPPLTRNISPSNTINSPPNNNKTIPYPTNLPPTTTKTATNNPQPMRASNSGNRQSPFTTKNTTIIPPNKIHPNSPNTNSYNINMGTMPPSTTPPPQPISNNSANYFPGPSKNIGINVPIGIPGNPYINPVSNPYPPTISGYQHPGHVYDPRASQFYSVPNAPGFDLHLPSGYPPGFIPGMASHPVYPTRIVTPIPASYHIFHPGRSPINPSIHPSLRDQQQKVRQAINLLFFLKDHPNIPQHQKLKDQFNKLCLDRTVHDKVTRYFQDIRRN